MTDLGAKPALDAERGDHVQFLHWIANRYGGQPLDFARCFNFNSVPEKDKKTPNKKKKEPNKKLEALKKKAADERAKHLKTVQEMKKLRLQAKIENKKKIVEKRKSLLQKEEDSLKTLMMEQK